MSKNSASNEPPNPSGDSAFNSRWTLYFAASAQAVAEEWEHLFELCKANEPVAVKQPGLWCDTSGLGLLTPGRRKPYRLNVDKLRTRLKGRSDLCRACGLKSDPRHRSEAGSEQGDGKRPALRILDPFAGFCVDALTLGLAGASVRAVEHHPLIYALASDLLARFEVPVELDLGDGPATAVSASTISGPWDVVYLDPMFAPRTKAALPGLAAQILRELNPSEMLSDAQGEEILTQARTLAPKVVLKRPLKDPVLSQPNHQLLGRTVRFDIYV